MMLSAAASSCRSINNQGPVPQLIYRYHLHQHKPNPPGAEENPAEEPKIYIADAPRAEIPYKIYISEDFSADHQEMIRIALRVWEVAIGKPIFLEVPYDENSLPKDTLNNDQHTQMAHDDVMVFLKIPPNAEESFFRGPAHANTSTEGRYWSNDPDNILWRVKNSDIWYNTRDHNFGNAATGNITMGTRHGKMAADLITTTVHEIGHALGLAHIYGEDDSVMRPAPIASVFSGDTQVSAEYQQFPSLNDIKRVHNFLGCFNDGCNHQKTMNKIQELLTQAP